MFNETETALFMAILDEIIPPSADGGVPGAGQAGVVDFFPVATPYAADPVGSARSVLGFVEDCSTSTKTGLCVVCFGQFFVTTSFFRIRASIGN